MRRGPAQSPESSLLDRLGRAGVCTSRDLARARSRVNRLGDDLPMFESVWLDALVQLGVLTPYQVERVEAKVSLTIGDREPLVILNQLGAGPLGETLLVRDQDGTQWAAKRLAAGTVSSADLEARLGTLLAKMSSLVSRGAECSVCGPVEQIVDDADRWLLSPWCDGPSALDLLISRGRFPAAVVAEMARQLIQGLARLEAAGLAHGDIRPAHIRLTRKGQVVLVDAGLRACLDPEVSIHSRWSVDRYEGVAPELIGTGDVPEARSDHYALGCALYQLLTGRPPFPGGDPLGKLAAHQLKSVPDVRDLAPETDDRLADELRRWTARDPRERSGSWRETRERWTHLFPSSPAKIERYRALCERPTPRLPDERRCRFRLLPGRGIATTLALLVMAGGLTAILGEFASAPRLLAIGQNLFQSYSPAPGTVGVLPGLNHSKDTAASRERDAWGRLALPRPTAEGVIELEPGERYRVDPLTCVGNVKVRTRRLDPINEGASSPVPDDAWATILPDESPWAISCTELQLDSVRLAPLPVLVAARPESGAKSGPAAKRTTALLHVVAARLDVRNVRFDLVDSPASGEATTRPLASISQRGPAAIHWQPTNLDEARAGDGRLENVVWFGHAAGITITAPLRTLTMENCLKVGLGPAIALSAAIPRTGSRFILDHVTLRESGAALRWGTGETLPEPESLVIDATDCVFQPHASAALIEWFGEEVTTDRLMAVSIQGSGSIMPETGLLGQSIDPRTRTTAPVDLQYVTTDGLAGETPKFIGPATNHPADAALAAVVSPRRTDRLQGIDPGRLASPGVEVPGKNRAGR